MKFYERLSWGAVALHVIQAIVVCALTIWLDKSPDVLNNNNNHLADLKRGVFPLYKTVHFWAKTNATTNITSPIANKDVWIETVVVSVLYFFYFFPRLKR